LKWKWFEIQFNEISKFLFFIIVIFIHSHLNIYNNKGFSQLCTGLLIGKISDKIQLKTMTQFGKLKLIIIMYIIIILTFHYYYFYNYNLIIIMGIILNELIN